MFIRSKTLLSLLLLLLLALLFLWRVPFRGDILLSADMLLLYEPWHSELPGATAAPIWNEKVADPLRDIYAVALYIKATWQQGEIPFWYPYAGLGMPILARGLNQVAYPLNNLLWQMMDVAQSFGWSAILHLFLASGLTFFYLRVLGMGHFGGLVAAIAFAYSSVLSTWLGLPFIFDSMVWLPLLFLGLELALTRQNWRWSLLGGLGLALQILAGSLQLVSYGLTALGLYALLRFILLWWEEGKLRTAIYSLLYTGLIVGVGLGLAAFQVAATLELVREGIVRSDVLLNTELPLRNLARLLIPDLWGTPVDGHNFSALEFESYLYLGLLPLLLIPAGLVCRRGRILFGIGLLFVLVTYNVPPFYQIFAGLYPAFGSLGFHRSFYVVLFLWAVTAGIGADYLLVYRPARLLRYLVRAGVGVGLAGLTVTVYVAFLVKYHERHFWNLPAPPQVVPGLSYHLASYLFFLLLWAAAVGLLWLWARQKLSGRLFAGVGIALLVADLFLAHIDFTPALPRYMLQVSPPSLTALQEQVQSSDQPLRVSGVDNVLRPDTGGAYGIPSLQIHDSYLSRRFSLYADLTGLRRGGNFRDIIFQPATNPLLNALNARYIYASRADLSQGDWLPVLDEMGLPQVESTHPEAGQLRQWTVNNWSQRVLYAPAPTVLSYQGLLPYPALLETAITVDPEALPRQPLRFEVYLSPVGEVSTEPVYSHIFEPPESATELEWLPIQIDLSRFVEQPVIISLVTRSESEAGESEAGGWAEPLITDSSKYKPIYYGVNTIYENRNYLPRAWVVHNVTPVSSIQEAAAIMQRDEFDPAHQAVVEGNLPGPVTLPPEGGSSTARFAEYTASQASLAVDMAAPGLLILSDLYYPGWQAALEGGPEHPVYPANITMRAIYLPAGQHQLRLDYQPFWFWVGVYISLGTALVAGLAAWLWPTRTTSGAATLP